MLALLNSSLQSAAGRRVALGSLLYKLIGLLLIMPFLDPLVTWMNSLALDSASLVIGFHVAYNSLRCVLLLPTVGAMARLSTWLLPERPESEDGVRPRNLDPAALATPGLALANAVRETLRIGDLVEQMLEQFHLVLRDDDRNAGQRIRALDDDIDALYSAVKLYLAQINRDDLSAQDNRRWAETIELAVNLEHAGDLIEHMLGKLQSHKTARAHAFSEVGLQELLALHAGLRDNLRLGLSVFLGGDRASAQRLLDEKRRFQVWERRLTHAHVNRLSERVVASLHSSGLHLELIADMKRLNSLFCASAYPVLEAASAASAGAAEVAERVSAEAPADAAAIPPAQTP